MLCIVPPPVCFPLWQGLQNRASVCACVSHATTNASTRLVQVIDLLKLWSRKGSEAVFETAAITAALKHTAAAKREQDRVLSHRTIGAFMPCSDGTVFPLLVKDWFGTFGTRPAVPVGPRPKQVRRCLLS